MAQNLHLEIFNKKQKTLFEQLDFLPKNYYLAGGTAVALYLGHRTSVDFDIYTPKQFKQDEIYNLLLSRFSEKEVLATAMQKNTFLGVITDLHFSVFHYPYKLVAPLYKTKTLSIASIWDVALMKIIAAIQRPAKRDYIDLYYLLQKVSLSDLLGKAKKKYPNFNFQLALRALTYFEDVADESIEKRGIKLIDKKFSWSKLEKFFTEEVRKYQIGVLKGKL